MKHEFVRTVRFNRRGPAAGPLVTGKPTARSHRFVLDAKPARDDVEAPLRTEKMHFEYQITGDIARLQGDVTTVPEPDETIDIRVGGIGCGGDARQSQNPGGIAQIEPQQIQQM